MHTGKSIPKAKPEGGFEELLKTLTPSQSLFDAANAMFKTLWTQRESTQQKRQAFLKQKINKIDRHIEQALDRIVAAESSTVVKAFEKRITDQEKTKLVLEKKLGSCTRNQKLRPNVSNCASICLHSRMIDNSASRVRPGAEYSTRQNRSDFVLTRLRSRQASSWVSVSSMTGRFA